MKKRILLTILSLIGLALAVELCVVYYNANFAVNAAPSICAINDAMDCDGVAKTTYSQFFGVPLSLWGVFLYLFFLFMTFVDKLQNVKFFGFFKVFKNPSYYIFSIALLSFCISMLLGCISVFKIGSVCIFCFMTYLVNLLIAICAKSKDISVVDEIKTTVVDFIDALKIRKYFICFVLFVILGGSVLTYTAMSNILTPQIAKQKQLKQYIEEYKGMENGLRLGPENADLVINEYMDFNCAGCFIANLYIHRVIKEFENVAVIQHNLPLDIKCNHNMKHEGHPNSCLKAYYALAAAKQNKYWLMSNILFQDGVKTEKDIISQARLLDFDIQKLKSDANGDEVKNEVTESIKDADSKNIQSTPTLYIGMRMLTGVGSFPEFRNIIIEQGGREKNAG